MERKITASIVEVELKEVTFKRRKQSKNSSFKMIYTYEIDKNQIKFDCDFDFKLTKLHIKSKYEYEVELHELEEDEIEDFLLEDENEVFYPLFSKMSGLIMKITEEVNRFPFITPTEIWEVERKNG